MDTQDSEAVYYYQAIILNIRLIRQILADFPAYVTPNWDSRATKYIPKLQSALTKLEKLYQMYYGELLGATIDHNIMLNFVHDVRPPLAMMQIYCHMLERLLPEHDSALFLLYMIKAYMLDIRDVIDDLFMQMQTT
jgi:hypothetical protein